MRDAGQRMLSQLDIEIAHLPARRRRIRQTPRNWDRILPSNPGNRPVFLLESLDPQRHG
ncbi:MAG TPA: hypothetical protein VKH42_13275 [Vicinamibacterales bacterium]|nr:hypothetical protein [Vicinamibacterales bacterium]